MTRQARLLVGGRWTDGASTMTQVDKHNGAAVAELHLASPQQVAEAIAGVVAVQAEGPLQPYRRYEILARASRLVAERADELVGTIISDSGFTVADARGEVARAVQTLLLSGEAAKRLHGEVVPLDGAPGVVDRLAFTIRVPVGVVAAITPFNSPLNTVAHKVGPALAAGNGVVLKPATATPLTANALAEILLEAGLPPGLLAVVHGRGGTVGEALLADERIAFYTFTGSTEVGRAIQRTVGLRRTQLELGSIASTIVCDDVDPAATVAKVVPAAFRKAGQVCTSVQRLYVHASLLDDVVDGMRADLADRTVGDPRDAETFVGPLITPAEAGRVESWIHAAATGGADVAAGGSRDGAVVAPTVLVGATHDMDVMADEVFGPVVSVVPFTDLDAAIADVNDTPYGLSAGVFTNDLRRALRAAHALRVGGVHVNETSSSRVDLMPYGGVKDSGFGREGPEYAAAEMTEERLVTIRYGD